MKREEGFYLVKFHGIWVCAEWHKGTWYVRGWSSGVSIDDITKINETKLIPPQ